MDHNTQSTENIAFVILWYVYPILKSAAEKVTWTWNMFPWDAS